MLLLRNEDVRAVLDMPLAMASLRQAYVDLAAGEAAHVPRIDVWSPTGRDTDHHQFGSMVGTSRSAGVLAVRLKSDIVSFEGGTQTKWCSRPGLFSGMVLLYSLNDGEPLALIQDGLLQHVRVGAAGGIGADLLAVSDADTMGLIGSGGMAEVHLEAIAQVRSLLEVRVFSRDPGRRERFAAEQSERLGIRVRAVPTARDAVSDAPIVISATDAIGPTLDPADLARGAHVTCITRRELSDGLLARIDIPVQLGEATIPYGLAIPGMEWRLGGYASYVSGTAEERARVPSGRGAEILRFPSLDDVVAGRSPGRTAPEQTTLFVNLGTQGLQFAAVGAAVLAAARERGLGTEFPTDWFLQTIRN